MDAYENPNNPDRCIVHIYSKYVDHRQSICSAFYNRPHHYVDEQLICETTGHRSAAVRKYKRTGAQQKEHKSAIFANIKVTNNAHSC